MAVTTIARFGLAGLSAIVFWTQVRPGIPKTWDERALAELEVPLADAAHSPKEIPPAEYYRLPVRPIYKDYPRYHPDSEPPDYFATLRRNDPVVVWDDGAHKPPLETEADWIRAGELVFDSPVLFFPEDDDAKPPRADNIAKTGDLFDRRGISPYSTYVVRQRGKLEVGEASCRECHTRLLPDGTIIKGAQGNRPVAFLVNFGLADLVTKAPDGPRILAGVRASQRRDYAAPWLTPDPQSPLERLPAADIEAIHSVIPAGVFPRQGTSPLSPAKLPDLIGIRDRKYLDATGLVRHRGPGDLMRYAALNQGMDVLSRFGDFVPADATRQHDVPTASDTKSRYSDEQLYALALYIYSLKPPPNPNAPSAATARGERIFERERCAACHTPPLYTNNRLMPAPGFTVPADHRMRFDVMAQSIGTDPTLTMTTRRGTGYYKVPSLKGVWYRGPFEHNGSVATLEDWFDPRRLRDDYVPTGFRGHGVKTRAVKGHPYGLTLSADDRSALIAFLKTL